MFCHESDGAVAEGGPARNVVVDCAADVMLGTPGDTSSGKGQEAALDRGGSSLVALGRSYATGTAKFGFDGVAEVIGVSVRKSKKKGKNRACKRRKWPMSYHFAVHRKVWACADSPPPCVYAVQVGPRLPRKCIVIGTAPVPQEE